MRPDQTPPDIENAEQVWWQKFAEIEDRYCWVQPPAVQRVLRRHYLQEIIRNTPPEGRILELGCGTGWLCRLLAELSARRTIVGVDFSAAQIALARKQTETAELTKRIQYYCADGTSLPPSSSRYDTVIVHGFLHHLNRTEIQRTLLTVCDNLAANGRFFIFEPFRRSNSTSPPPSLNERLLRALARLANRGRMRGWRAEIAAEKEVRTLIAQRNVGVYPFGPSPKEMPFGEDELESYLHDLFVVTERRPCMAISHLVVQEWLLRELSNPMTTRLLFPIITHLTAWLDRRFVATPPPSGIWTFDMLVCRRSP